MPASHWTEAEIRADAALHARGFNTEYDAHKSVLNGGLDRTSTDTEWVTRGHLVDGALHLVNINDTTIELPTEYATSGASDVAFNGLTYSTYAGGWATLHSETITGLKAGVMHAEFSCFTWMFALYGGAAPKGCSFRILWDGVVVAEVGPLFQNYNNPFLCADFPIAGDGVLSVEFAFSPPTSGTDSSTDDQFFIGGGQLLAIGRWR